MSSEWKTLVVLTPALVNISLWKKFIIKKREKANTMNNVQKSSWIMRLACMSSRYVYWGKKEAKNIVECAVFEIFDEYEEK
jgi:hypothetical protein